MLIDTIQKQLKDHPCRDSIREAFRIYDTEASGYVDRETFFKICDSLHLPVDDSLIKEVSRSSSWGGAGHPHWLPEALACAFCLNWGRLEVLSSDLLFHPAYGTCL